MGGKTKIVNNKRLESLYVSGHKFGKAAGEAIVVIKGELAKLNDPTFQSGLSGGQGEAAKDAIAKIGSAVEKVEETVSVTTRFIDSKLASAIQLAKDKQGFGDIASKAKSTAAGINLKK